MFFVLYCCTLLLFVFLFQCLACIVVDCGWGWGVFIVVATCCITQYILFLKHKGQIDGLTAVKCLRIQVF